MKNFCGNAISWACKDGVIELALHREPCNELGTQSLAEFEKFIAVLPPLEEHAHALIIYSQLNSGFSAGADLRETYYRTQQLEKAAAVARTPNANARKAPSLISAQSPRRRRAARTLQDPTDLNCVRSAGCCAWLERSALICRAQTGHPAES
jgi:enoyl-CoA hydratase/carnithine racemase